MKNIVIFGAPGSGKGTQSELMIKKYGLGHISTGDVLRNEIKNGTELGKTAKGYIDNGQLIPDDLMVSILASVYDSFGKEHNGVIFDGFPRTIPQAEALENEGINIDHVIEIDVPDEEIVQRLSGRRQHPASGRVYHIVYNPPKVEGKDDETGEELVQRPDDQEATIRKRLGSYHTETEQLVGFYQGRAASGENAPTYDKLNGLRPIDEVQADLFAILDQDK